MEYTSPAFVVAREQNLRQVVPHKFMPFLQAHNQQSIARFDEKGHLKEQSYVVDVMGRIDNQKHQHYTVQALREHEREVFGNL